MTQGVLSVGTSHVLRKKNQAPPALGGIPSLDLCLKLAVTFQSREEKKVHSQHTLPPNPRFRMYSAKVKSYLESCLEIL